MSSLIPHRYWYQSLKPIGGVSAKPLYDAPAPVASWGVTDVPVSAAAGAASAVTVSAAPTSDEMSRARRRRLRVVTVSSDRGRIRAAHRPDRGVGQVVRAAGAQGRPMARVPRRRCW